MITIHPNLKQLSNSSKVTLHKCPRKYELEKLSLRGPDDDTDDYHLVFGKVVGAGIQEIMISGDMNKAYMVAHKLWHLYLDDDSGAADKKTFWHALYALDKFQLARKTQLANYELAYFDGKPAVEVSFRIDCGNGFYDRGYIDFVAVDKLRQKLVPFEAKTTKFNNVHEAVYKNSGQGLGYSLVVDKLTELFGGELSSSYTVQYPVYKTKSYEWEIFPFQKSHTSRALWIKQLLTDIGHVNEYGADGYFPMHGENCYDFFRPCQFFGVCEMSNGVLVPKITERVETVGKYQFEFSLDEIIDNQLDKYVEVTTK